MIIKTIKTKRDIRNGVKLIVSIMRTLTNAPLQNRDLDILVEFLLLPVDSEIVRYSPKNKRKVIKYLDINYGYKLNQKSISPLILKLIKYKFLEKQEDLLVYTNKKLLSIVNDYLDKGEINISIIIENDNLPV